MSLAETYEAVYAGLDSDQMTKVGSFAFSFMEAMATGSDDRAKELVKEAMQMLAEDSDSFNKLLGTLEYAELYGSVQEKVAVAQLLPLVRDSMRELDAEAALAKTAGDWSRKAMQKAASWKDYAGLGLGAASVALGAAPFVSHLMDRHKQEGKIKQSLTSIMQEHPELRSDPNTARYFQAVVDFAPSVASNPLVAGNVLKTMHQIGPGSVTPKMISELLSVQSSVSDQSKHRTSTHLSNLGQSLSSAGKMMTGKPESGRLNVP